MNVPNNATVDDEPIALYSPARDEQGALDPAKVTADFIDLHQAGNLPGGSSQRRFR